MNTNSHEPIAKEADQGVLGISQAKNAIATDLDDNQPGKSFSEYLNNPNTIIVMKQFPKLAEWLNEHPIRATQVLCSTTNCIDGRPVLLHNSATLLLRFLVEQKGKWDESKLEEFVNNYVEDPIRKEWFDENRTKEKIGRRKIIAGIKKCYNEAFGLSQLFEVEELYMEDKAQAVDLLTEGSGYPGGGLGFAINYADTIIKNRNALAKKMNIPEKDLIIRMEDFFKRYGGMLYYHSCNGNYGQECKYAGCAAMKHFMSSDSIDSQVQKFVEKHVLGSGSRKSVVLNGKHDEENRITVATGGKNGEGVGVRNDVRNENDLGKSQSFVLNLQLEGVMFDAVTATIFPGIDGEIKQDLRTLVSSSLKQSLIEINPKLGTHTINIGTVVNGKTPNGAIHDVGSLLNTLS